MRFDLETFKQRSGRLDDSDIDYDRFRTEPLDEASLRCLRYMHDVEFHTACYLRDVLVTRAHAEPDVTAFLSCWAYEELWHGEAIAKVLAAHGEPAGRTRVAVLRAGVGLRGRLAPWASLAVSSLTRHVVAVQVTWGAVNEWTTQAGYGRLAERAGHPVLTDLLRRIMRQEGRHIDFYATQAFRRLQGDRRAQRLTRLALTRFWKPVGSDVLPDAEVRFLIDHLFDGEQGRAVTERLDRNIDRLPGLEGLRLVSGAAARCAA